MSAMTKYHNIGTDVELKTRAPALHWVRVGTPNFQGLFFGKAAIH